MVYTAHYKINNVKDIEGRIYADKDSEAYELAYEKAKEMAIIYPIDNPGMKDAKTRVELMDIINQENKRYINLQGKQTVVKISEIEKILSGVPLDH